jgi:hypothetical protein
MSLFVAMVEKVMMSVGTPPFDTFYEMKPNSLLT